MEHAYIGRQPIFDRELHTYGYELLFRSEQSMGAASVIDGNIATSQVMVNAFLEIGIEHIVGNAYAFFNLTNEFITGEIPIPFKPGHIVLEVLEDISMSEQILASVKKLSAHGFTIALDDFVFGSQQEELIPYVDIIKIEYPAHTKSELEIGLRRLTHKKKYGARILAEKIETEQDYLLCRELGFDLFQGYFLSKPHLLTSTTISENNLDALQIMKKLQDPNMVLKDLEELIAHDVSLTYKILHYINSAHYSFQNKIESITQAVTLLGLNTIKQWVTVLLFTSNKNKPHELIQTALVRSRMCALMATALKKTDQNKYVIVGLFSMIDLLMDCSMELILSKLPLAEDVNAALISRSGEIGEILSLVIAYEQENTSYLAGFLSKNKSIGLPLIQKSFLESIAWSHDIAAM